LDGGCFVWQMVLGDYREKNKPNFLKNTDLHDYNQVLEAIFCRIDRNKRSKQANNSTKKRVSYSGQLLIFDFLFVFLLLDQ